MASNTATAAIAAASVGRFGPFFKTATPMPPSCVFPSSPMKNSNHHLNTGQYDDCTIDSKEDEILDKSNPFIGYFHHDHKQTVTMTTKAPQTSATTSNAKQKTRLTSSSMSSHSWKMPKSSMYRKLWDVRQQAFDSHSTCPNLQRQDSHESSRHPYVASDASCASDDSITLSAQALDDGDHYCHHETTTASDATRVSRYQREFEELGILGRGGQGFVYKVRHRIDNRLYAIKKINMDDTSTNCEQSLREVRAMAKLAPQPNIVRYHTAWIETVDQTERLEQNNNTIDDSDSDDSQELLIKGEEEELFDSCPGFIFETSKTAATVVSSPGRPSPSTLSDMSRNNVASTVTLTDASKPSASAESTILYIQMELCVNSKQQSHRTSPESRSFFSTADEPEDLSQWLHRKNLDASKDAQESVNERLQVFHQIVQGVEHLHSHGLIHRDLKPENVFMKQNMPKIGDFGLAKCMYDPDHYLMMMKSMSFEEIEASILQNHTTALGTFLYASPEQLGVSKTKASYSELSDIYSLGIILLELFCPFKTMMERAQVLAAARHGVFPPHLIQHYPEIMSLVMQMTATNANKRPSATEILIQLRQNQATMNEEFYFDSTAILDEDENTSLEKKFKVFVNRLRKKIALSYQVEEFLDEITAAIAIKITGDEHPHSDFC